jgi:hypothetical protein
MHTVVVITKIKVSPMRFYGGLAYNIVICNIISLVIKGKYLLKGRKI